MEKVEFPYRVHTAEEAHNELPGLDLHCLPSNFCILSMI